MKRILIIAIMIIAGGIGIFYVFQKNIFLKPLSVSEKRLPFLKTAGQNIIDENGKKVFLKGVNFGHWLFWEGGGFLGLPNWSEHEFRAMARKKEMSLDTLNNFFDLIYENYITQKDFAIVKSMGNNFIRLTLHHSHVQENQFARLDQAVSWAKNNGIYVMFDLQAAPGSQNPDFHSDSDGTAYLWSNTAYQQQFIELWKNLAKRYKDEPTVLGYELLNEPVAPEGAQLVSLYQQAITAIRAIDNKHMIFLDGNNWAYDFDMFNPASLGDNIVYVFHAYRTLEEEKINVQKYKTFQNNFQVPIICNEYGGAQEEKRLTAYFQTEGIPYAPWGYKLGYNSPDLTPFYYISPRKYPWRIELLNKIAEWMKASEEYENKLLTAINGSNFSSQLKQDLIDILNKNGELPSDIFRTLAQKYLREENKLKNLSLKVDKIKFNSTMEAFITILMGMSEKELTEMMQLLQTQYWEKGILPW